MPSSVAAGPLVSRVPVWTALALVALAASCTRKPVVVVADPPPLAVPVVPPRLVGPVQVEDAAPPPVDEVPERPAPRTTPRAPRVTRSEPAARPADGSSTAEPKPEAAEPAATAEAPSPNLLRTAETADDREATRRVKEILGRAESNLSKVNYKTLSTSARAQHDNITRLIAQAEEALRTRSFTFARYLADKAEVLSGSLANR